MNKYKIKLPVTPINAHMIVETDSQLHDYVYADAVKQTTYDQLQFFDDNNKLIAAYPSGNWVSFIQVDEDESTVS